MARGEKWGSEECVCFGVRARERDESGAWREGACMCARARVRYREKTGQANAYCMSSAPSSSSATGIGLASPVLVGPRRAMCRSAAGKECGAFLLCFLSLCPAASAQRLPRRAQNGASLSVPEDCFGVRFVGGIVCLVVGDCRGIVRGLWGLCILPPRKVV